MRCVPGSASVRAALGPQHALLIVVLMPVVMYGCAGPDNTASPTTLGDSRDRQLIAQIELNEHQALADLEHVHQRYAGLRTGQVADHSDVAAAVDPDLFGIAVATVGGEVWAVGDDTVVFPLQSLSKTFTLALVLDDRGHDALLKQVGSYATGLPFGSLAAMEIRATPLQNPMVSMGAIATTSLVAGRDEAERWNRTLRMFSTCAGRTVAPLDEVVAAEWSTSEGSLAKAYALAAHGLLYAEPRATVERYLKSCSVGVNVRDLAVMGATLAAGGVNPVTGERAMQRSTARGVLCAMITAGMYDDSGPWLFRVGLPAKSGVSGGVVAVLPGQLAIAVYSPPLDRHGNSVRATAVLTELTRVWALHFVDRMLPQETAARHE